MKKFKIFVLFFVVLGIYGYTDAVKQTKSQVTFKKFGTFSTEQSEKITSEKKRVDSKNHFKGKGLLGGAAKLFFKKGDFSEIINLPEEKIYRLNHKKKLCRVSSVKPFSKEQEGSGQQEGRQDSKGDQASNIKVIRDEFKVKNTGEKKTINQFSCSKYQVTWDYEWENLDTGEKGTNGLATDVWTTPMNSSLQKARNEEMQFFKGYMKKMGLNADKYHQDILGTQWLQIFGSLSKDDMASNQQRDTKAAKEFKKLSGYPIVIDGKYYSSREGGNEQEGEPGEKKSVFGRLAKNAFKKKKDDSNTPDFTFYTEVVSFGAESVAADLFRLPENYKVKELK